MNVKQAKIIFYFTLVFFLLTIINWSISNFTTSVPDKSESKISNEKVVEILLQNINQLGSEIKIKKQRTISSKENLEVRREITVDVPQKFSVPDFLKNSNSSFLETGIQIHAVENIKLKMNSIHFISNKRVIATLILV